MTMVIHVKITIKVVEEGADIAEIAADRNDKEVIFKTCAPFTECIGAIPK